ncbi:hypothetical protein [Candidatus Vondammii sp. HM_W22]|uniref:hypothetical protein n=1 Tax=Candidatus Vondammii sp. HM_W22 TaxID=2687299 RepID=UPI001F137210|nr:hypothetical protein [Candidatus Vondammii sp. HM_W22]
MSSKKITPLLPPQSSQTTVPTVPITETTKLYIKERQNTPACIAGAAIVDSHLAAVGV